MSMRNFVVRYDRVDREYYCVVGEGADGVLYADTAEACMDKVRAYAGEHGIEMYRLVEGE